MSLSGKVIIKAQLGNDIRRIPIHNEDITYDELLLMMQRVFRLEPSTEIQLKYRDEDDEQVSILDDSDVMSALQCSCKLRLLVLVPGTEDSTTKSSLNAMERHAVRRELQSLRDKVNVLLDQLSVAEPAPAAAVVPDNSIDQDNHSSPRSESAVVAARPSEFDPLKPIGLSSEVQNQAVVAAQINQSRVVSSFGLSVAGGASPRAGTPDSTASAGSSRAYLHQQQGVPAAAGFVGQHPGVPPVSTQQQQPPPQPQQQPQQQPQPQHSEQQFQAQQQMQQQQQQQQQAAATMYAGHPSASFSPNHNYSSQSAPPATAHVSYQPQQPPQQAAQPAQQQPQQAAYPYPAQQPAQQGVQPAPHMPGQGFNPQNGAMLDYSVQQQHAQGGAQMTPMPPNLHGMNMLPGTAQPGAAQPGVAATGVQPPPTGFSQPGGVSNPYGGQRIGYGGYPRKAGYQ